MGHRWGRPGYGLVAHQAHRTWGQWMRSSIDYVVAVGAFHTPEDRAALT